MRQFGLIGYPLSHSFSVGFFATKFANENIHNAVYQNFPLEYIEQLPELLKSNPNLVGINVTIPYKQKVMPFLTELDETAMNVGAVNTIKISRENNSIQLIGYNTDVYGFEQSIKPHLESYHKNALILGTGGASKAVIYVLQKLNIDINIVSRSNAPGIYKTYSELTVNDIRNHKIIINTTPLGMYPNIEASPSIPYGEISSQHILFDLIYNPLETNFLKEGNARGAKTINGLKMLHLQALKAWDIWNC